jgi:hypothetical protein
MVIVRCATVAAGLGLLAGCGSSSRPPAQDDAAATVLQEVNSLLRGAAGATGRPPSRLADLDKYQMMFTRGYAAVKSGDVVVLWGTPLKGEGEAGKDEAVVAYGKGVPKDGGYVLMSAGTVKKMTAEEFGAAPKAGKK